jgi:hypothetical protein
VKPGPILLLLPSLALAAAANDRRLDVAECFASMPLAVFQDCHDRSDQASRRWKSARQDVAAAAAGRAGTWSTVDLTNGFILFPGDDGGEFGAMTMTLFRQADGAALIAIEIRETYEQYGVDLLERRPELKELDGDLSATDRLRFYRVTGTGWHQVTDEVCPEPEAKDVRYELPRKGTTIRLYRRGANQPFRAWLWDRRKFTPKRLP